jgi:hypothetical protein
MSLYGSGSLGFQGLKVPTGYGSVSLKASINGIDLGNAWSKKTTYSEGTEHAEDAVVDLVEQIEAAVEFPINMFASGLDVNVINSVQANKLNNKANTLVIDNLTASPCSRARGTCDKPDLVGCAERLIALAKRNENGVTWKITVNANHLYQPQGVANAKQRSAEAVQDMQNAGITVNVP